MGNTHNKTTIIKETAAPTEDIAELTNVVAEEQKMKQKEKVIAFLGIKGSGKSTIINAIVKQFRSIDTKFFIPSKYHISTCAIYERTDPIIDTHAAKSFKYLDLINKYKTKDAEYIASQIGSKVIHEAWNVFVKDYDLLFIGYMNEIEKK
eukprot:389225_1